MGAAAFGASSVSASACPVEDASAFLLAEVAEVLNRGVAGAFALFYADSLSG